MTFDASKILLYLFSVCLVIGAVDLFRGNPWKLGERFSAGIRAFEPLFLTMAGILVLIPLFRIFLAPVLTPVYTFFGIDPAVFAGSFLANDMGAFPLAHSLTENTYAADFSGMLLGSVLGVNFVFTLPAALKMIDHADRPYLFRGLLYGFLTVPLACLPGGLAMHCPVIPLLKMLIPILLLSLLAILLLRLIPEKLIAVLTKFGRCIEGIALTGIVLAIFSELTGISNFGYLEPIQSGITVVGSIIIVLPGAYVFITLLDRGCHRFFHIIGQWLSINDTAVLGLFTSLANSIPTFQMIRDMDPKGKTMNFAFLTGGAFAFGDHLAYCCAVAPKLAGPLLITKLTSAVSAILLIQMLEYFKHHNRERQK